MNCWKLKVLSWVQIQLKFGWTGKRNNLKVFNAGHFYSGTWSYESYMVKEDFGKLKPESDNVHRRKLENKEGLLTGWMYLC